jgi:ABC-type transporter Mla subunit MlaD
MSAEDSLQRAEELLSRLEAARARLEQVTQQDDPDAAIEVLQELAEIAKDVNAEVERTIRQADAER